MREIKFRAWVGGRNEMQMMRYDFDAIAWRGLRNNFETPRIVDFTWDDDEFEEAILMQYTGLKDKNGKEIYEGDIVSDADPDFKPVGEIWEVRVEDLEDGVVLINDARSEVSVQHVERDYCLGECEVIGNIYENPELIKE